MIPAFGLRDDGVGVLAERGEVGQKTGGDERHVAAHHQRHVAAGLGERGVHAAKRSAARHEVGHGADAAPRGGIADHQDFLSHLRQFADLAIENGPPVDRQRPFVASAESNGPPARQNGRGNHHPIVL